MGGSDSNLLEVPSLPDDALVQILSRLRAKSLCRCKCVSKPWRDLITDRLCCKDLSKSLQGFLYFDKGCPGGGNGNDSSDADADGGDVGRDEILLRHGHGRFINLLGKPVSLLDSSFAFMKERPGVESVALLDSCNGLLLFGHRRVSDTYDSLGYIVCNPITEQWVAVPSSGWTPTPPETEDEWLKDVFTLLIFDPSVSSHFDLVQFWQKGLKDLDGSSYEDEVEWVHTYSSITRLWSDRSSEWRGHGGGWEKWGYAADIRSPDCGRALVNGMLHILIKQLDTLVFEIVAVDSQGRTSRVIEWPDQDASTYVGFIGQSQGRLHCISPLDDDSSVTHYGLSVWVLEDYDTEEWVLKHSLSLWHLYERINPFGYSFVGLHTDRNIMFFVYDRKLISYDMDSREACVLCTHGSPYYVSIKPYVPSLKSL